MGFLFLQKCIFPGLWQARMKRNREVNLLAQEKAGDYKSGEACLKFKERKIYARCYRAMLVRCFFEVQEYRTQPFHRERRKG